jgi:hypothetical protein
MDNTSALALKRAALATPATAAETETDPTYVVQDATRLGSILTVRADSMSSVATRP